MISLEWFEIVENLPIPIELKQGLYQTELVENNGQNLVLRSAPKNRRLLDRIQDSRSGRLQSKIS